MFESQDFITMMRLLPRQERTPILLGILIEQQERLNPKTAADLCHTIDPDLPKQERDVFETIIQSGIIRSCRLPITLEEFPSRIWRRALASGSLKRAAGAALLSRESIGEWEMNVSS